MEPLNLLPMLIDTGMNEAYVEHRFYCWRKRTDGADQQITVRVLEAGEDSGLPRYRVIAESEDGKHASGNSHDDVRVALAFVHWHTLDK